MPVKEKQDHFTIEQVAKDLKLGVEEVKQLIMKGAMRMAVLSADVEEIASLDDPSLSTAWYGRADPLDYFIAASGLNLPEQDRKDCDLSESAWGMSNAKNVETSLLADLPKFLYLKSATADSEDNLSYRPDAFEIFSGELVRIVFVEDVNFNRSKDEPEYKRKILSINVSEPVISREEKKRFMDEYEVEEKPFKESERENLLKLIGILAHSYATLTNDKGASKFLNGDTISFRQVAEQMDYELDSMGVKDKAGISVETNQRKISEGLKLLKSVTGYKAE